MRLTLNMRLMAQYQYKCIVLINIGSIVNLSSLMMIKAILVATAECTKQLNITNVIVLQILSDVSCNLAKLVTKLILGGFIQ